MWRRHCCSPRMIARRHKHAVYHTLDPHHHGYVKLTDHGHVSRRTAHYCYCLFTVPLTHNDSTSHVTRRFMCAGEIELAFKRQFISSSWSARQHNTASRRCWSLLCLAIRNDFTITKTKFQMLRQNNKTHLKILHYLMN